MVTQALGELPAELRLTPELDERLVAQAKSVSPVDVVRLIDLIAAALRAMKDGADARTQLDLALVKAAEPAHDPSAKALLARLERLEGRTPAPPPPRDPAEPATAAGRTRVAVAATTTSRSAAARARGRRGRARPRRRRRSPRSPSSSRTASSRSSRSPSCGRPSSSRSAPSRPGSPRSSQEARPTSLADQDLTIAWPESAAFSKRQAEDPEKREMIAQSIRAVTGASLRLAYELGGEHAAGPSRLSEDELVDRFKQEFGAVEEEPPPPTPQEES